MKKKYFSTAILSFLMALVLVSCSSKEDELIGSWSTSFGIANDYTQYRVYSNSEFRPTFFQTFTFEKGKNGEMGTFTDNISPLVIGEQNPDEVLIGSKISGTWEIKDKKLYLYFDDEGLSLTNADDLGRTNRMIVEDDMTQRFLDEYKKLGEDGLSYEIVHKNDKTGLEINFGNTKLILIKKEDKK